MLKSERLGVRVTPQTKKELEKVAKNEKRSMSNLIEIAIEQLIREHKETR